MGATSITRHQTDNPVNLNQKVEVELTERGIEVLNDYYTTHFSGLYTNEQELQEAIRVCHGDVRAKIHFQLYELMAIFGPSLPSVATSLSKYILFTDNEIVIIAS